MPRARGQRARDAADAPPLSLSLSLSISRGATVATTKTNLLLLFVIFQTKPSTDLFYQAKLPFSTHPNNALSTYSHKWRQL